jgi:ADP-ribose pyrophosphatase YjhB (NUDIX family)
MVSAIVPCDEVEASHRADTLAWLESTDDVFRWVKPATPSPHLVSYVVLVDADAVLLVDHINAGLWLPPGGHVEPDEHPAETARRELAEELGVVDADVAERPAFLTVTRTIGIDAGHTDVSLWFVVPGRREQTLTIDRREFRAARWWSLAEVEAEQANRFDPHFARFLSRTARLGGCRAYDV